MKEKVTAIEDNELDLNEDMHETSYEPIKENNKCVECDFISKSNSGLKIHMSRKRINPF